MTGFFSEEELEEGSRVQIDLKESGPMCAQCGLQYRCNSPRMSYTGEGKKKCLIISEAPGTIEDQMGEQLMGHKGHFLREKLSHYSLQLDKDFWKIDAINCAPFEKGKTREPLDSEIDYCRPIVDQTIRELQPEHIWLLGTAAVKSFIGHDFSERGINRWRGLHFPDRKYNAWIHPMFDLSYGIRNKKERNITSVYDRDLKESVSYLDTVSYDYTKDLINVDRLYSYPDVINLLDSILDDPPHILAHDYETTGLKPYRPGHKTVSISLCFEWNKAYSFPYQYRDHFTAQERNQIKKRWRQILIHEAIKKLAHNAKFEDIWSRAFFGVKTVNWEKCTMIDAHILDPRKKFTKLKFQGYINTGIRPYDKEIESYIDSKGKEFNTIEEFPLDKLLKYGGIDSQITYWLNRFQSADFNLRNVGLEQASDLFHEGWQAFSNLQWNGIHVNEEYYRLESQRLKKEIERRRHELQVTSPEAKAFRKKMGRRLDVGGDDLGILLYEILNIKAVKTDKGNYTTAAPIIEKFDLPYIKDLIHLRKLEKIRNTYLAQFRREAHNGKMHPFQDLNIPRSYRSSNSKPNFQNIPVRDEEAKKSTRSGIIASPGNQILEPDFSGIEVGIGACYHKDPNMIKYIKDKSTDMHRDSAMDIWLLPLIEMTSDIRFYGKNEWVFPQFYGSWYKECAKNLWEHLDLLTASGIPLRDHLKTKNINSLAKFEAHCRKVQDIFWKKRFKVYQQWKDRINEFFIKHGYVETFFGFECLGNLTPRMAANRQIQGTAFHVLLWTLIETMKIAEQERWKSKMMAQIHDSMIFDAVPGEVNRIIETVKYVGEVRTRETFDWIIVPLEIDFEITPVDGCWATKAKMKLAA